MLLMTLLLPLANAAPFGQGARIRQGVRNGTLKRAQAARLRANQRRLRKQLRKQNRRIARLNRTGRNRAF